MSRFHPAILALSLTLAGGSALSADPPAAPEKKTTLGLYLTAKEAYELKTALGPGAMFFDVRSRAEVNFLGMPTAADANVPFMELPQSPQWDDRRAAFRMEPAPGFADDIDRWMTQRGLGKDAAVILMCRSGDRSSRAANVLAERGYTRVYSLVEGYEGDLAQDGPNAGTRTVNGWRNAGLPWSYRLDRGKVAP